MTPIKSIKSRTNLYPQSTCKSKTNLYTLSTCLRIPKGHAQGNHFAQKFLSQLQPREGQEGHDHGSQKATSYFTCNTSQQGLPELTWKWAKNSILFRLLPWTLRVFLQNTSMIFRYIMVYLSMPLDPSLIPWSLSWPCATCMVWWRNTQIQKWGGLDNGRREKLFFQLNSGFLHGNETLDSIGCSWIRFMNGFSCISQLRRMCCQKKYKNVKDVHHPRLKLLLSPWSHQPTLEMFGPVPSGPFLQAARSSKSQHRCWNSKSQLDQSTSNPGSCPPSDVIRNNSGVMKLITPPLYGIFIYNCWVFSHSLCFLFLSRLQLR